MKVSRARYETCTKHLRATTTTPALCGTRSWALLWGFQVVLACGWCGNPASLSDMFPAAGNLPLSTHFFQKSKWPHIPVHLVWHGSIIPTSCSHSFFGPESRCWQSCAPEGLMLLPTGFLGGGSAPLVVRKNQAKANWTWQVKNIEKHVSKESLLDFQVAVAALNFYLCHQMQLIQESQATNGNDTQNHNEALGFLPTRGDDHPLARPWNVGTGELPRSLGSSFESSDSKQIVCCW